MKSVRDTSAVIGCREAVQRLWRFLDGELDTTEHQVVQAHLDDCVHCCGELEFASELRSLLGSQQTATLPTDVRDRLERFIDTLGDATDETA